MAPGLALSYFKGLRKHIDFAGTLAGTFAQYTIPNHAPSSSDKFLLEADVSLNFKMVSEKYWLQPYLLAGLGASNVWRQLFRSIYSNGRGYETKSL